MVQEKNGSLSKFKSVNNPVRLFFISVKIGHLRAILFHEIRFPMPKTENSRSLAGWIEHDLSGAGFLRCI